MQASTTNPTDAARGRFVAVGQNGQRIVSANGTDWANLQTGKEGEIYRAVCHGNGRFVAVGTFGGNNLFAASADGVKWETATKDGRYKDYVRGVGFGDGRFVAVGGDPGSAGSSSPFVLVSDDGLKWGDFRPITGKNILRRITCGRAADGSALLVGVGDRGRRAASKDGGLTWADAPNVKPIDTLVDVAFGQPAGGGPGRFVGVGLHGLRMTSPDGITWSERLAGEEGEHLNSVLWTGDRFVAVGMGATYSSPDGQAWKRQPNKDAPLTAVYGKGGDGAGLFVGVNWKGRILASADAAEWKQVYKSDFNFEAVTYGTAG